MLDFLIILILIIAVYLLYCTMFGTLLISTLEKKTKFSDKDYYNIGDKLFNLFYLGNIFCFLFLPYIRNIRKYNFYKNEIDRFECIKKSFTLSPDENNEYLKYKRYIKLKNINDKHNSNNIFNKLFNR